MKKIIILGLSIFTINFISCTKDSSETTNITNIIVGKLDGTWVFQNQQPNLKLIFKDQNFTLKTGTISIKGVFQVVNNHFQGTVTSREGASSDFIQPDAFSGDVEIVGNKVAFSKFTGNWALPFSSWYQRQ